MREKIEFNGELKTKSDWARTYNIPVSTLFKRLSDGWTLEEALGLKIRLNGYNSSTGERWIHKRDDGVYEVIVGKDKVNHYIGRYITLRDAIKFRNKTIKDLYGVDVA